jgi:putative ABC transport system permease protein
MRKCLTGGLRIPHRSTPASQCLQPSPVPRPYHGHARHPPLRRARHRHAARGFAALRGNPLRTALSALGVVIGVGALVSVLALSDGVEAAVSERLAQDGRLLTLRVAPRTGERVDGQWMPRADRVALTAADARALAAHLAGIAPAGRPAAAVNLSGTGAALVAAHADTGATRRCARAACCCAGRCVRRRGGRGAGCSPAASRARRTARRACSSPRTRWPCACSPTAARRPTHRARASRAPPRSSAATCGCATRPWRVVGVLAPDETDSLAHEVARRTARGDTAAAGRVQRVSGGVRLAALVPVARLADAAVALPGAPPPAPELAVVAPSVGALAGVRAATEQWLAARLGAQWADRVELASYETEGREAARVMRLFRLLMAAITGVSLVVGGVGIMNVLLASVSERTREIGIAKAVGARARDVLRQYLAESVAIALAGAVLGSALGLGTAHLVAALMRSQAEIPVRAGLSPSTIAVAAGAPILVGLVFGLYPALRAARLSPIDAIRHE